MRVNDGAEAARIAGAEKRRPERVSVAMCTYNGTRFLPQQLQSILEQSEPPDEVVVCDDGSTDGTVGLLREFAASAPFPVEVHENPEKLGAVGNFVRCLELCRGEILVLSDQDDLWFPYRVAETRAAFAADPEITFAFSDAPLIDDKDRDLGRTLYSTAAVLGSDRRILEQGRALTPVIHRWGLVYGCTLALRARFLRSALPVPDFWGHDTWIAFVLSGLGPSVRMSRPVTHYRQHDLQAVGAEDWTMRNRVREAQERTADMYRLELRRYEAGMEALEGHPEVRDRLLPELAGRYGFLRKRLEIREGGLRHLPPLLNLLVRGEYWRHGAGLRSVVKDAATMVGVMPR